MNRKGTIKNKDNLHNFTFPQGDGWDWSNGWDGK